MNRKNELTIRGTKNGLVINLPDVGELDDLLSQLKTRLHATASFFRGGRVALQVGIRDLSKEDLERIGGILDEEGVSLWSVFGKSELTQSAAREWGLETDPFEQEMPRKPDYTERQSVMDYSNQPGASAILIRRTLRSGQRVVHPGDVTLIGDVNPGAEIVAGGSIVVWGKLRGTAHAGASGDDGAVVCALSLYPTQLRIGNYITRSPEGNPTPVRMPEIASVQGEKIVAEPWSGA